MVSFEHVSTVSVNTFLFQIEVKFVLIMTEELSVLLNKRGALKSF